MSCHIWSVIRDWYFIYVCALGATGRKGIQPGICHLPNMCCCSRVLRINDYCVLRYKPVIHLSKATSMVLFTVYFSVGQFAMYALPTVHWPEHPSRTEKKSACLLKKLELISESIIYVQWIIHMHYFQLWIHCSFPRRESVSTALPLVL